MSNEIAAAIMTGTIKLKGYGQDHTIAEVQQHLKTYHLILDELNKSESMAQGIVDKISDKIHGKP